MPEAGLEPATNGDTDPHVSTLLFFGLNFNPLLLDHIHENESHGAFLFILFWFLSILFFFFWLLAILTHLRHNSYANFLPHQGQ